MDGEQLKIAGLERIAASNKSFLERIRKVAISLSRLNGRVTSDSLRTWAALHGMKPTHRNAWGAIFRQKGWVCIGWRPSRIPGNHGRHIRIWRWDGDR